jgi:hypothetical protein
MTHDAATVAEALGEQASSAEAKPTREAEALPGGPLYLYGIVPSAQGLSSGEATQTGIVGVGEKPVYLVAHGTLSAIVSPAPSGRLRPERRNLAAHQTVLREMAQRGDVLPMAFGIVATSRKDVVRVLRQSGTELREQITRVAGRVEMTVRLSLGVPNLFLHVVESDAELRVARDRMVASGSSHDQKMEVGRMFERAMNERRDSAAELLRQALDGLVVEEHAGKMRGENDLYSASFLVDRAGVAAFEAAIDGAAATLDDHHVIDLSGPWPPHSFVDARLDLDVGKAGS